MTVLHDLVDRFISKNYYNDIEIWLAGFLRTDRAERGAHEYLTIFSDRIVSEAEISASEVFPQARRNLARFKIVRKLKRLSECEDAFRARYRNRLSVGKLNVGDCRRLDDAVRELVEELCSPDLHF